MGQVLVASSLSEQSTFLSLLGVAEVQHQEPKDPQSAQHLPSWHPILSPSLTAFEILLTTLDKKPNIS
jgi:hypothetical protein